MIESEMKISKNKNSHAIICVLIFLFSNTLLHAQLDLKRDDYTGDANRNWWQWHDDGPNTPVPAVNDGYVLFSLVDPDENFVPYCDAALWDGYPGLGGPYHSSTLIMRIKAMNPHKYGSRGWGLWYTEPFPWLQQQAWFMAVLDDPAETGLDWWRAETSNGKTEATHHYTDLDQAPYIVDDQLWHIYEIIRETTYIVMKVDGDTVLHVTEDVPQESMAFHIWVDNLVYEHVPPDTINVYKRGWTGKNDIVMDYIQIITQGSLDKSEAASGIKVLRHVPNEIYTESQNGLWKSLNFTSDAGDHVVLITARVEQYLDAQSQEISGDDDLRIVLDGYDYGWNTSASFNGDANGTTSKTLLIEQPMDSLTKSIEIYAETSPLLYDVTVLSAKDGGIVFQQEYNETKSAVSDSLWKEIQFETNGGQVVVYISGTADEDPDPTNYGYRYTNFDDAADDDMRIMLDGTDYGYKTDDSFYGNRLFGEPKSVLILENLSAGSHTLRLYGKNTPTLFRIVIYGENDKVQSSIEDFSNKPQDFKLSQNYPNPFNGSTRIDFTILKQADVQIYIINALGERVKTLANGIHTQGSHSYLWDGTNVYGRVISSGVYFYRLMTSEGRIETKKLLLLK